MTEHAEHEHAGKNGATSAATPPRILPFTTADKRALATLAEIRARAENEAREANEEIHAIIVDARVRHGIGPEVAFGLDIQRGQFVEIPRMVEARRPKVTTTAQTSPNGVETKASLPVAVNSPPETTG